MSRFSDFRLPYAPEVIDLTAARSRQVLINMGYVESNNEVIFNNADYQLRLAEERRASFRLIHGVEIDYQSILVAPEDL